MKQDNAEALGRIADTVSNLLAAMTLPMPPAVHLVALKESLPEVRDSIRRIVVDETGEDPWGDAP